MNPKIQDIKSYQDGINKNLNDKIDFFINQIDNEIKLNDVIQFLLKYQYSNPSKNLIANWERECK